MSFFLSWVLKIFNNVFSPINYLSKLKQFITTLNDRVLHKKNLTDHNIKYETKFTYIKLEVLMPNINLIITKVTYSSHSKSPYQ